MSAHIEINAQSRSGAGKGASRRLRREGLVPGIVYGGDEAPAQIALAHHELAHEMEQEAFFSSILTLKIDGGTQSVVIKDVQRHPARPFVMHVDFQRIKASEKIHMTVPLHFLNEASSAGVKKGGSVLHAMTDLEIVCLPGNLPEFIGIDLSDLDLGATVHVAEVKLPEGVELHSGVDTDAPVVSIVKLGEMPEHLEVEGGAGEGAGASED